MELRRVEYSYMKHLPVFLIILLLAACTNQNQEQPGKTYAAVVQPLATDSLLLVTHDKTPKFGSACAIVNATGDTVVGFGRYEIFEQTKFTSYIILKSREEGIVGINRKGEILFDAYLYGDAQADQISEGLFRVKQNGKIGYANQQGQVVIPCQYRCAQPFENGRANVAISCTTTEEEPVAEATKTGDWFYIDLPK